MRSSKFFVLFVFSVLFVASIAYALPDRVKYTLFDDFETGECYGWEPYPYQQDIGYDAQYFTRKSPTYMGSKYALARPVTAVDAVELYQGFTKRLNMFTASDSRIKVAVFFQGDRNPSKLELSLGLFDGRRFFYNSPSPEANKWLELDVPAQNFKDKSGKALGVGENIQVVTIKGEYNIVYYLFSYTILIDNFSISGERQRRFEGKEPASFDFDKFDVSVLKSHYFWGDAISLAVEPESGSPVKSVGGNIIDSNGKTVATNIKFFDDGTNGDKTAGDGVWTNSAAYKVTDKDARGQWEIKLSGIVDASRTVEWGIKFMVPGKRLGPKDHPRLLFYADELAARIAGEKSPIAKKILDNALADRSYNGSIANLNEGQNITDEAWTTNPYPKNAGRDGWREPMNALGGIAYSGGMKYAFTGDKDAGEKAKAALLKLCGFKNFNNPWMLGNHFWTYYPVGYVVRLAAYGYDLTYNLMTESERKFCRDAIMEKGLKLFQRDMVEMNRMPSNMTNHISVLCTGMGLAAIAMYGDDPQNPTLEPYLSGVLTKTRTFVGRTYYPGGSYGEPFGYQAMATRELVEQFDAFERNFGVDLSTTTNVKDFYQYPLYATDTQGRMQDFGDGGGSYTFTAPPSLWFTYRLKDPYLYNYVKPLYDSGRGGYDGYLWFVDGIEPKSRESLPTSRMFEGKGNMIMRSGWDEAATIIIFKSGPNSNHYHYDQGNFVIRTNGEELLQDPGTGGGYYQPYYRIYNSMTVGHNTLLLDMDSESQWPADYDNRIATLKSWPKMIHSFAGDIADAAEGDLACVYKGKLSNYTRTLLYTKSGALFVLDRVKSYQPHEFEWLFHAVPANLRFSNGRVTIDKERARLTMDVLSPELASGGAADTYDQRSRNSNIRIAAHQQNEGFVALASKPNLTEAVFFAVITPEAKPAGGNFGDRPVTSRIDSKGWIGAKTTRGDVYDMAMFRLDSAASNSAGGFDSDASRFTASFEKGKLVKAYFEGSSFSGSGINLVSSAPLTAAAALMSSGMNLEVNAAKACDLKVASAKASQVLVNGSPSKNFKFDQGTGSMTISLPQGKSQISIR
jgi:hypothetical protein